MGITPRRWLGLSNPELTQLIQEHIGPGFLTDLSRLEELKPLIDDPLIDQFNRVKLLKKQQLCDRIWKSERIVLAPDFIFDVQVKRLHEYKRQLLNALSIMAIYQGLKEGRLPDFTPTACLFGAKAAPGYDRAKAVIRYINRIARLINGDPAVQGKLQVLFVQNYNCSYAEQITPPLTSLSRSPLPAPRPRAPATMKLMLNGAVTLGTPGWGPMWRSSSRQGAGKQLYFRRHRGGTGVHPGQLSPPGTVRRRSHPAPGGGHPGGRHRGGGRSPGGALSGAAGRGNWHRADHYFLLKDFSSYLDAKLRANRDYQDRLAFGRKCLLNLSSAGKFSSDRTIRQYAEEIWHI